MFGRKSRRLLRENDALREALGWYATSSNWRKKGTNARGEPRKWIKSPAAFDRGARAKFVLTQLDKQPRNLLDRVIDAVTGAEADEPRTATPPTRVAINTTDTE